MFSLQSLFHSNLYSKNSNPKVIQLPTLQYSLKNLLQYIYMNQEFIVNIVNHYPFGQIQKPKPQTKVYIRKIVKYTNKESYAKLKQKIQVLKIVKNPNLIKLVNILEGEGLFHLVYEYVPKKFQNNSYPLTLFNINKLQSKLSKLFATLFQNNISTVFLLKNLGIDQLTEPKYFLDVQAFQILTRNQIPKNYDVHITKILQGYYSSHSSGISNATKQNQVKKSNFQKEDNNQQSKSNYNKYQSSLDFNMLTIGNKKVNPLQMLNVIQKRLQELKRTTKYNPKMRQTFQMKQILRQTVKQKWQKQKVKTRKMSGNTIYDLYNVMKESMSKKNDDKRNQDAFNTNRYENKTENVSLRTNNEKNDQKKKNILSKTNFQDLKKQSFQKYTASKQSYVQEFLNILGDDSSKNQNSHQNSTKNFTPNLNIKIPINLIEKTEGEQINRKQRINKAIKKSNMALQKYQKKPVQIISSRNNENQHKK